MMRLIFSGPLKGRTLALLALTFTLVGALIAASARARLTPIGKVETPPPALSMRPTSSRPVELRRLTIRPTGFDPTEVTYDHGRFVLAIHDRSGLEEITLQLKTVSGQLLKQIHISRENPDVREQLDLATGSYTLTEVSHPNWVCSITVAD